MKPHKRYTLPPEPAIPKPIILHPYLVTSAACIDSKKNLNGKNRNDKNTIIDCIKLAYSKHLLNSFSSRNMLLVKYGNKTTNTRKLNAGATMANSSIPTLFKTNINQE